MVRTVAGAAMKIGVALVFSTAAWGVAGASALGRVAEAPGVVYTGSTGEAAVTQRASVRDAAPAAASTAASTPAAAPAAVRRPAAPKVQAPPPPPPPVSIDGPHTSWLVVPSVQLSDQLTDYRH